MCMTHSGMLFRLDISTFYFYKPLLFQIFIPWKFFKYLGLPFSSFLLHSRATYINPFICFKYHSGLSFFIKIHVKVFIFKFDLNVKPLIFSNKNHSLHKKALYTGTQEAFLWWWLWEGGLSKNVDHRGWPMGKKLKKHWLKRPLAVS